MMEVVREINKFGVNQPKREYIVVTLPFSEARKYFSTEIYQADTGFGEQRELIESHVKSIKQEIIDDNFTPTSVTVGLRDLQCLSYEPQEQNIVSLKLSEDTTLPLLDGGHRFFALEVLYKDEKYRKDIGDSAITALIMLNGNTKKDFLNLQKGRPVDKSHIYSLSIQENLVKSEESATLTLAYDAAKILNEEEKSPFYKQIRFDSRRVSGIPISTLSSKGASDIATSLVGGAKIAIENQKDAKWYADCIITCFTSLKSHCSELLEPGMKLCPPPRGTKGSATMLIGIGNMLAYRIIKRGDNFAIDKDIEALISSAKRTMSEQVRGNFSGSFKRDLMRDFTKLYFSDICVYSELHYGIPIVLIKLLSASTFSLPKLGKNKKKKTSKSKKNEKEEKRLKDLEKQVENEKEFVMNDYEVSELAPWEIDI